MGTEQIEHQIFAIQDLSAPYHNNHLAVREFLTSQIGIWVTDSGYPKDLTETLVDFLTPLMGNVSKQNSRGHAKYVGELIERQLGGQVDVFWTDNRYFKSAI